MIVFEVSHICTVHVLKIKHEMQMSAQHETMQITVGHRTIILSAKIQVLTGKILSWSDTVTGHLCPM